MDTWMAALIASVILMPQLAVHAQQYPNRPIKFVLPFVTGLASDVLAASMKDQTSVWKTALKLAGVEPQRGTGLNLASG